MYIYIYIIYIYIHIYIYIYIYVIYGRVYFVSVDQFSQRLPPRKLLFETLNRHLPLKHCSVRIETLPKRVLDGSQYLIFRRRAFVFRMFSSPGNPFLSIWSGFGGATGKWISKSDSSDVFALDTPMMSSVRPKIIRTASVRFYHMIM